MKSSSSFSFLYHFSTLLPSHPPQSQFYSVDFAAGGLCWNGAGRQLDSNILTAVLTKRCLCKYEVSEDLFSTLLWPPLAAPPSFFRTDVYYNAATFQRHSGFHNSCEQGLNITGAGDSLSQKVVLIESPKLLFQFRFLSVTAETLWSGCFYPTIPVCSSFVLLCCLCVLRPMRERFLAAGIKHEYSDLSLHNPFSIFLYIWTINVYIQQPDGNKCVWAFNFLFVSEGRLTEVKLLPSTDPKLICFFVVFLTVLHPRFVSHRCTTSKAWWRKIKFEYAFGEKPLPLVVIALFHQNKEHQCY